MNEALLPDDFELLKAIIRDRESHIEFLLFNEAEVAAQEAPVKEQLAVPAHTRQKPKRKPLPEHLPRTEVTVDIAEEEKVCACGTALSRIGEECLGEARHHSGQGASHSNHSSQVRVQGL